MLASEAETQAMKANYQGGNYGYGHAKQALFELILTKFEGLASNYYWSSNEYDNYDAWDQDFTNGNQYYNFKYDNYFVRAVRAF